MFQLFRKWYRITSMSGLYHPGNSVNALVYTQQPVFIFKEWWMFKFYLLSVPIRSHVPSSLGSSLFDWLSVNLLFSFKRKLGKFINFEHRRTCLLTLSINCAISLYWIIYDYMCNLPELNYLRTCHQQKNIVVVLAVCNHYRQSYWVVLCSDFQKCLVIN